MALILLFPLKLTQTVDRYNMLLSYKLTTTYNSLITVESLQQF